MVIMACCREIFDPKRHGNCVGARTKAEATKEFDRIRAEEEKTKKQEMSKDEKIEALKNRVAELEAEKEAENGTESHEESKTENNTETQARGDSSNLVKEV